MLLIEFLRISFNRFFIATDLAPLSSLFYFGCGCSARALNNMQNTGIFYPYALPRLLSYFPSLLCWWYLTQLMKFLKESESTSGQLINISKSSFYTPRNSPLMLSKLFSVSLVSPISIFLLLILVVPFTLAEKGFLIFMI